MFLRFRGYDFYPDTLNEAFKISGCYSADLIPGDKVAVLFNGTFGGIESYDTKPAPLDKIKLMLDSGKPVICEVDFNDATYKKDQHFVLAVGYTDKSIIINDPWDGGEYFVEARYPNPNPAYPGSSGAILGLRVYDFPDNHPAPQPTDIDRIIQFLKEKGADNEGAVREMYGAWQDLAQVKQNLSGVQEALSAKLAVIQEKDRIISDLQTTIDGYQAQVKSYTDFIEEMAQKLSCPPDISEILGEAEQAIQNETKLIGAIESQRKAEEKYLDAQTKESLATEALVKSEASIRELTEQLNVVKSDLSKLQTNYDRLKSIVADKRPPSIISYFLWRTIWRQKNIR